ncbi:MAG: SgcJ/EcaC family oxidoreductase [Saprospiraceae bacterium]|jgi:uncharacterized protein (TIGR02246 family)|nr:SgcJ/EcaC family oxidoreductase [Saprospiraceae bacterium]
MKNIILTALTLLFLSTFTQSTSAQTASNNQVAVLKMWDAVWQAYEVGDEAKMWSFYAADACEIYPDGSSLCGLKAIREGYEQFKGMLEGKPSWTYPTPVVQFIEPNVALLIAEINSDIKLKGGQQLGGKMKFVAILHKEKGQWLIAFDSQTPIVQMPEAGK